MDKITDSGVSPVLGTFLLLALSVVMIVLVMISVNGIMGEYTPVYDRSVGFTIKVNATNSTALITPVSGTDLPFLESYRVYTTNGQWDSPSPGGITVTDFNSTVHFVNIVGNFTDQVTALVFSGKVTIEGGQVVIEPVGGGYYGDGSWGNYTNVTEFADVLNDWYHTYYNTTGDALNAGNDGRELNFNNLYPIIVSQPIEISEDNIASLSDGNIFVSVITGGGTIIRAPGYVGPLFVIGETKNKVTIKDGVLIIDGDKVNTSATSPALVIDYGAILEIQNSGALTVMNNYNGAPGGDGGGIYNAGTISVSGSNILIQVTNNTAVNGGGIYNAGTLDKLSNTYVTNNHASSLGGAVYNTGTIKNSVITRTGNTVGPSYTPDNNIYNA